MSKLTPLSLPISQEAERHRRMEWEKSKRVELQTQKEKEQGDIQRLKDRKRSLEMELEAVVRLNTFFYYKKHYLTLDFREYEIKPAI